MEKIENGVYVRKFFFFNKMNNPIWKRSFELTNGIYLQKQNGYTNEVFQMENIPSGQRGNNQKTKEEDVKNIPSVCDLFFFLQFFAEK